MNIVWFTWKDKSHPEAGGAENISSHIVKGLAKDGHNVIVVTSRFPGSKQKEIRDGYKIIRVGNRYTVYWEAYRYYKKHLTDWADEIVEEINTIPFMTQWYARKRRILLIYQLCREIWFYQIMFPLSIIGYVMEPIYSFLLRNNYVITESESTKKDLQKYGFKKNRIHVVPVFIDIKPLSAPAKKYEHPTVLSLGTIRSMKRTLHQIMAFESAKESIPDLKMIVAGSWDNPYGRRVKRYIETSAYAKDISFLGSVSVAKKTEILKKSHIHLMTSIKEGWGLTVTEAASQGTPTIGYNVDGLRDSIAQTKGGSIVDSTIDELSKNIVKMMRKNITKNSKVLVEAVDHLSKEKTYKAFIDICKKNHLFQ